MSASLEARFWSKVEKADGCWLWRGVQGAGGYGTIRRPGGGNTPVHRVAYELLVGPIPSGLEIDHVKDRGCTSRACVNPEHLEPVTHRENILRGDTIMAENARKTHCKRGHPLSGDNLYRRSDGGRQCRACTRMHLDAFHARQRGR